MNSQLNRNDKIDDDDRLVRSRCRSMRDNPEEFSQVVRQYGPRMLRLALGIVHRRDAAEDVVQDALVKAYERLDTWRGEGALSTWLYRIVYTTAVSSLRGRRVVSEFSEATAFSSPASGAFDVSGAFDAHDPPGAFDAPDDEGGWELTEHNIVRMRRALERLSPLDRTLVTLFYLEDRSIRDISAICGHSESNVKTRLHRSRTRLRQLMAPAHEFAVG